MPGAQIEWGPLLTKAKLKVGLTREILTYLSSKWYKLSNSGT